MTFFIKEKINILESHRFKKYKILIYVCLITGCLMFSSITLALTLEGEKDPTQTVDAMRQFETYTWSLVGVTCFLILTTAFGVIG